MGKSKWCNRNLHNLQFFIARVFVRKTWTFISLPASASAEKPSTEVFRALVVFDAKKKPLFGIIIVSLLLEN
jgi:hypothetical protein